jgi:hypothetical protein
MTTNPDASARVRNCSSLARKASSKPDVLCVPDDGRATDADADADENAGDDDDGGSGAGLGEDGSGVDDGGSIRR